MSSRSFNIPHKKPKKTAVFCLKKKLAATKHIRSRSAEAPKILKNPVKPVCKKAQKRIIEKKIHFFIAG
jgi:hypothetical protein